MPATNALTLACALALGALAPGCMVPETPRTWVSHHAKIAPPGPDGRWNAAEIKFIQDSLTVSATRCGLKPTSDYLSGISRRKNTKALAEVAAGKKSRLCYLGEFSRSYLVQVKAYYLPFEAGRSGGQADLIEIDYVYSKTTPIAPPEEQQADAEWATFFEPLDARFDGRLRVEHDKLLRRND